MQLAQKELTEGPDKASAGVKSKFPKSIAEIQPPFNPTPAQPEIKEK